VSRERQSRTKRYRIVVIDDHEVVRKGLAHLINQEPDLQISGEAIDAPGAIKLITAQQPAVAIVDISLDRGDGIEVVKEICRRAPRVAVLVLSMHEEWLYADRVARAGARGFVGKQEASGRIVQAIRSLVAGGTFFGGKADGHKTARSRSRLTKLSDRELEIFHALGQGSRAKQIAGDLGVSIKTIESHVSRIKAKLGIQDATRLLRYAALWHEGQSHRR
jgi:DNA-binding NarL/FixJ family response regulator